MGGYVVNFTVYTMAMIGLIFFALFVYKKVMNGVDFGKKSNFLNIEEKINLAPRKNLYVIRAGKERFLIASDADRTNLISKLDEKIARTENYSDDLPTSIIDFPQQEKPIKSMLNKINRIRE